jgi:hypothetical protein
LTKMASLQYEITKCFGKSIYWLTFLMRPCCEVAIKEGKLGELLVILS